MRWLFIGHGWFEPTKQTLEREWKRTRWDLWLDGHRVNLPAFGTSDRSLLAFPPAGGKDVILREWNVTLAGATPGKHTVRSRSQNPSAGTADVTWTFVIGKR